MFAWIGGAIEHDELIAAFDRLDSLDAWIDRGTAAVATWPG